MAGQPDVIGDLRQYGIDIVDDNEPRQFFELIQDCLCKNFDRPGDSGTGVWREAEGSDHHFKKLADDAKDFSSPHSLFPDFYNFMRTKIFTLPNLSINQVIERAWDPRLFEVSSKAWDCPPVQNSINPTSTAQPVPPTPIQSSAKTRSTTEKIENIAAQRDQSITNRERALSLKTTSYSIRPSEGASTTPPSLPKKLVMPRSYFDLSYWIDVKVFPQEAFGLDSKVFVTNRRCPRQSRGTSPYLSIAFDDDIDSTSQPPTEKKQHVMQKLALYGCAALYNRLQLFNQASTKRARRGQRLEYDEASILLHFGIMVFEDRLTIYGFKYKDAHAQQWTGCTMNTLYDCSITDATPLRKAMDHLNTIHEWGMSSYIKGLKIDIDCLLDLELL